MNFLEKIKGIKDSIWSKKVKQVERNIDSVQPIKSDEENLLGFIIQAKENNANDSPSNKVDKSPAELLFVNKMYSNFKKTNEQIKFKPDYSNVTNFVFKSTLDEDSIDMQITLFASTIDGMGQNAKDTDQLHYYIEKLKKHTMLAIIQKKYIQENINELHSQVHMMKNETELFLADSKKRLGDVENTKSDLYTDFIAILGVFSALLFGLFVGFDVFKEFISTIASNSKISRSVIMGSLLLVGLNFLIFLLFDGISKLTNKNLKTCCADIKCKHFLFEKYPVFIFGNTFLAVIICISAILMIMNNGGEIYQSSFILAGLSVLVLLLIIYLLAISFIKTSKNR